MNIQKVIQTINQMQADGVIERYAIGGAVGATFYLEPVATLDVDIFITFKAEAGRLLVSSQPIFDYLKTRGGVMDGEHIVIPGWPVQFLPPVSPLVEEALAQAVDRTSPERPPAFSPPNISPPSPSRPDAPRTRRGCCNSGNPARWTRCASGKSSPATTSCRRGKNLNGNFSHHEF